MADIVAGGDDIATVVAEILHTPGDFPAQFIGRGVRQHLLHVDGAVEGEPVSELGLQRGGIEHAGCRGLYRVQDVNSDFD